MCRLFKQDFKCTSIGELTEDELRVEALKDTLAGQLGSSRFIAGDNLTIYDFSIKGISRPSCTGKLIIGLPALPGACHF